jgi:hypothetical protein
MIKKAVCFLILFSFIMTIPCYARIETKQFTFFVRKNRGTMEDTVKFTKNAAGIYNVQIPEYIEKLGFKITGQKWQVSDSMVTLDITAQKSVQADTAMMAYSWVPRFAWKVDANTSKITAQNELTEKWTNKGMF